MAAQSDTIFNAYDFLGVSPTAEDTEIRKAYRKLALKLHPDRNKATDAEAQFKRLAEAYDKVSTPEKRAEYDRSLESTPLPTPAPAPAPAESGQFRFKSGLQSADVTLLSDFLEFGKYAKSSFMKACHERSEGGDFFNLVFNDLMFKVFNTPTQERFESIRRHMVKPSSAEILRNFILFPSNGVGLNRLMNILEGQSVSFGRSAVIIVTSPATQFSVYEVACERDLGENIIQVDIEMAHVSRRTDEKPSSSALVSETTPPEVEMKQIGILNAILTRLFEVMAKLQLLEPQRALAKSATATAQEGLFKIKHGDENKRDSEPPEPSTGCRLS